MFSALFAPSFATFAVKSFVFRNTFNNNCFPVLLTIL